MQPTCLSLFPSIYKLKLPLAKSECPALRCCCRCAAAATAAATYPAAAAKELCCARYCVAAKVP